MEPDDMSFLEISGDDDSLLPLQQMLNDDVTSFNKTYFTCSPLLIPRSNRSIHPPSPHVSPIAGLTSKENEENLSLSSRTDSINERNASINKPEVPKLSMEPQQMKRKKKGGGYNLRKSLAWNQAFFTEEGVLDPLELSLISGDTGKSSGPMLSVIEEDQRESLVGESEDLTVLEENLFKELPVSTLKEDRKCGGASLPKKGAFTGVNCTVASTSATKRKVLSAQDVNRSGTKRSGCPRPAASSTVKRPVTVNKIRAVTRELNMPKIPVQKQDPSVHPATVKNTTQGVSNTKRNKNVLPVSNIGLKCSSNNSTSARSSARSGSQSSKSVVVKSSVRQAKRNVPSSALETQSSTNSQHSFVTKANDASKINPGAALPASGNLSKNHDSNEIATSFPSKFPSSGGSMQHSQIQTAKPSGLRMPSPSLGFFNQSKISSSHGTLQRSNKACNFPESNIPNSRKFDAFNVIREKPIPASRKMPDIVTGVTASANIGVPGSVTESSFPSNHNSDSLEKTESDLPGNAPQKVEVNVPSNFNSFDTVNNEQSLHICNDTDQQSLKTKEQKTYEKNSHAVDNELQCSENRLLLQSAPSDQLMKDDAKERLASIFPMNMELTGPKLENAHSMSQLDLEVQVRGVFETQDIIDNKCEENKVCRVSIEDPRSSSHSQSGDALGAVSESQSEEANVFSIKGTSKQHDDLLSCANEEDMKQADETVPSTLQVDQIKSESPSPWINNGTFSRESRSLAFQKSTSTEIANSSAECVAAINNFCKKSQLQSPNVSLSAGRGKDVLGSSTLDNMVVDENESIIDANEIELNSSHALCSKQPTWQGSGCDMAVEDPCEDDNESGFIDAEFRSDIKCHGQTTSGISEMLDKYQEADVFTNSSTEVSDVRPDSGYHSGCEMENFQCMTSPPSTSVEVSSEVNDTLLAMQVEGYSMSDEIKGHEQVEDKQFNLPLNNQRSDSELLPGDDISYCQQYMSPVQNNQLKYKHVVNNLSIEGNQIPEAHDKLLFEYCKPFEEFRESNASEVADVSLHTKSHFGSELENPAMFHHEYAMQTNEELAGVSDTIKNTSGGHTEHHDSDPVAAQVYLDDHGLSLNEKLMVNNCSAEELQEMNVFGSIVDIVLDHNDACGNKLSPVVCTQATSAVKNDGVDEDQKVEYLSEENIVSGSVEIEPSVKNLECYTKFRNDDEELSSPTWSLTYGVSLKMNEGQNSGTANSCDSKACCLQNKESMFSANTYQRASSVENVIHILKRDSLPEEAIISQNSDSSTCEMQHEVDNAKYATDNATMSLTGSVSKDVNVNTVKITVFPEEVTICQNIDNSVGEMQHESEEATMSLTGNDFQEVYVNSMTSDISPEEDETTITQKNDSPKNETQHALNDAMRAIKDKDTAELLKKSGNDKKQDNLVIKPPPHAAPFSDEWLAAFEAAGEEILTMKRGAVQHSPPDKTQPEPGPWSPVKRKNNQGIGPYDCTKYINNIPPSSS